MIIDFLFKFAVPCLSIIVSSIAAYATYVRHKAEKDATQYFLEVALERKRLDAMIELQRKLEMHESLEKESLDEYKAMLVESADKLNYYERKFLSNAMTQSSKRGRENFAVKFLEEVKEASRERRAA